MKTLIVVAHPDLENVSITNKALIAEAAKYPDKFLVHDLYKKYKNFEIDVKKEQELLESVDTIVLQYPTYWFNTTPLLKKWLDDVFLYGWAYGSTGDKLKGKKVAIVTTAGSGRDVYSQISPDLMEPFLRAMKTSLLYCQTEYKGHLVVYGSPLDKASVDAEKLKQDTKDYIEFLNSL